MKRILAAAAAASALTLTAACGSTDAGSAGDGSSSSTSSAAHASVTVGDTVTMADLGRQMSSAMKDKGTAKLSMKAGGLTMNGAMKVTSPVAYTMTMGASGQSVDMIYVDSSLYLGGEALASMLGGKKWVKVDPNGTDAFSKRMAPALEQMESATDPTKMYAGMDDVTMTVDSVDGDRVTYGAKLTEEQIKKYAEKRGQSVPSGTGVGDMSMHLTVTKGGLPEKVSTQVMGQSVEMTYTDWGTPVDIAAPPASEVGAIPGS